MQRLLLFIARIALGTYYRREAFGATIPEAGPLLLVANHPNGLIDPILLTRTTQRPVHLMAKATLFQMPILGRVVRSMGVLPVYRPQDGADTERNESTFEAVFDALDAGELVCLFPEGTSHSDPELRKLKTGAARMALGAEARQDFAVGVRIVPVGLVYRAKRRFRSRVATCVGEPIPVADLAQLHARDPRAAARALTDRIAEGLTLVTLTLDRWEDLPLIELAAALSRPRGTKHLTHLHEFAAGVRRAREREPERVAELTRRVQHLRSRLDCLGLGPENLHERYSSKGVLRFVARNLGALLLSPAALLGAVFWGLPYLAAPQVPRLMKVARDLHATVQVLAGMVLFPCWWAIACAVAWSLRGPGLALLVGSAAPLLGVAALLLADWRRERAVDVRAFLMLRRRHGLRAHLIRERDAIALEIEQLRQGLELVDAPPASA